MINEKLIFYIGRGQLQTAKQEWQMWFIARFLALI